MIYADGQQPFEQAGLRGYVDGQMPFEAAGLRGLGLELTDVTGGFSLQTVMLGVGAIVLVWVMVSSGKGAWDKGAQKLKARQMGGEAKKKVDETVSEVLKRIDTGDKEFQTRLNFFAECD
jgi:hypothetical protein